MVFQGSLFLCDSVSPPKFLSLLPRTLMQAELLHEILPDLSVIHIILNREVAIQKLLGRRLCTGCGQNFNLADVLHDGHLMPAIRPNMKKCPLGPVGCTSKQHLVTRSDDTETTISTRFDVFEETMAPILDFYRQRNHLKEFVVKRGIADSDELIKLMEL
jgi:adenylate kinase